MQISLLTAAEIQWQHSEENFQLDLKILADSMQLQDPLEIEINFTSPEDFQIDRTILSKNLEQQANILQPEFEFKVFQTALKIHNSIRKETLKVALYFYSSGRKEFSLYDIHFINKVNSTEKIVYLPIFKVSVNDITDLSIFLPDSLIPVDVALPLTLSTENKHEIFGQERVKKEKNEIISLLFYHKFPLNFLISVGIILLSLFLIKKYFLQIFQKTICQNQQSSFKQQLLKELSQLEKQPIQENHAKILFFHMISLLENYLIQRFQMNTKAFSENEIETNIEMLNFNNKDKLILQALFKRAFQVKFNHSQMAPEECKKSLYSIREIIHNN